MDFLKSALPWLSIGLVLAVTFAKWDAEKNGRPVSKALKFLAWPPLAGFLLTAILEYTSGDKAGGTTWLVLGICNAAVNFCRKKSE